MSQTVKKQGTDTVKIAAAVCISSTEFAVRDKQAVTMQIKASTTNMEISTEPLLVPRCKDFDTVNPCAINLSRRLKVTNKNKTVSNQNDKEAKSQMIVVKMSTPMTLSPRYSSRSVQAMVKKMLVEPTDTANSLSQERKRYRFKKLLAQTTNTTLVIVHEAVAIAFAASSDGRCT